METLLESPKVPDELELAGIKIPPRDLRINSQSLLRCPEILQAEKAPRKDRGCPHERRGHYHGSQPHLEGFAGHSAHLEDRAGLADAKDSPREATLVLHQSLEAGKYRLSREEADNYQGSEYQTNHAVAESQLQEVEAEAQSRD